MKFFKMLGQRITDLVAKLFSLNTVQFGVATILVILDKIPWYAWTISAAMLLGIRFLKALKGIGGLPGTETSIDNNPLAGIQG
jgi:hypothetical protein